MHKGTTIVAGLVAVPLLAGSLAACGGSKAEPGSAKAAAQGGDAKSRFLAAVDKTQDTQKQRMTLKLDTSPENLVKLAASGAKSGSTSKPMDPKIAKLIASSQLVMDVRSTGKSLKEETDQSKVNMAMAWKTDSDLVNFVMANQSAYFKLDLAKIADQTGAFKMSDVQPMLSSAPAWVQDAINGRWVGFEKATLEQLAKSGGANVNAAAGAMSPEQSKQLADAMRKNLDANATFTGDGDDIKGEIKLKPFAEATINDLKRIAPKQFDEATSKKMLEGLGQLKQGSALTFDSTLSDGKLKSVRMDVMQALGWVDESKLKTDKDKQEFTQLKSQNPSLPVAVEYSEPDQDVSAPSGARVVTQADLQQLMGGARGEMTPAPTPTS
ncbi:hypothetical protein [Arsenicicoccus sp. oral taxon 190]|uniref:hypothetical protein n=1 Tax=Arsenicicoccus sp. oral taxon 190 TaxID=1658671 RepID=UPI00067A08F0|nr:hypothetical protein [Arsenicicoccus sp. oral taxon 190]AKT52092.1 hypothetical protein ADJ73_13840 [Arsenicicoccus sp. oral taxon 190]